MANKRIKISELPRITFIPNATGTTVSTTSADYLPIAVTDRNNSTVKTTMTITTRELMRFVLQQAAPLADGTDNNLTETKMVIGRTGFQVEIPDLVVKDITVTGTSSFASAAYTNLDVTGALTVGSQITVGGVATYPDVLRDRNNSNNVTNRLTRGIFCSGTNGKIDGKGLSLESLVGTESIANGANAGLFATVSSTGILTFQDLGSALAKAKSVTSQTGTYGGNILSVGSNGELDLGVANTGLQLSDTTTVVTFATNTLDMAITNNKHPVVVGSPATATGDPLTAAEMVTHVSYNYTADTLGDTEVTIGNTNVKRAVYNTPVVLGYRHENGIDPDLHDLTDRTASAQVPAQIGEIRWNIFNNVPTLYLAVSAHPDAGTSGHADAKTWYGVPLFGTIDDDATDTLPITAHTYTDDD